MKHLKTYKLFEGYGTRRGAAQIDLDEIKTIDDIPESYHTKYYENRELTPHEKELLKKMLERFTSVVIPEDIIMDRLCDIKDMSSGIEIEIKNQIWNHGDHIDMSDIEEYGLHNLMMIKSFIGKESYAVSNIDITFPIVGEEDALRTRGENYKDELVDTESFHQACGMVNNEIKDFFESYANCEVECESYNTTIGILIRYK